MTKIGTIGGTLTIVLANITTTDIISTILLSALGAVVSYLVSIGMRRLIKWRKR